ncbi:MAG: hypothetical protein ACYC7D_08325 [Nitrososphaerales archaeon]
MKEAAGNRGFRLLAAFSTITFVEAIAYSWIEVLLYQSDSPVLSNTWIFGHYTTYHLVLGALVLSMVFGVGFFGSMLFTPARFKKFLLFAFGNLLLWLALEDEFTFIFSGSPHTATDWTNWPLGAVNVLRHFIPVWYFLAVISTAVLWYVGLTRDD